MAYFLKVTKQQTRTYLSIYESFYSHDVKGTRHRSYRNLGNIDTLIANGIEDPIAYYRKEVDELNAKRKLEKANNKVNQKLISTQTPVKYLGYFPLANILTKLNIKCHFDLMQSNQNFSFNIYEIISSLVYAYSITPASNNESFMDNLTSLYDEINVSNDAIISAIEFVGSEYEKFNEILTVATEEIYGINTDCTYLDYTHLFLPNNANYFNQENNNLVMALLFDSHMIPIGMRLSLTTNPDNLTLTDFLTDLKNRHNFMESTTLIIHSNLSNVASTEGTLTTENQNTLQGIKDSFEILISQLSEMQEYNLNENFVKGVFVICYISVLLTRIFQSNVLKNDYSIDIITNFINEFKVVSITNDRYINITKGSDFMTDLATRLHQPITNYHLTTKQIEKMFNK